MRYARIGFGCSTCRGRSKSLTALSLALAFGLLVGCSRSAPTGTVKGTVTADGGTPSGAYVNFFDAESGVGGATPIGPDGSFAFDQPLRVGQYTVTIIPPSAPPPLGDANATAAATPPEIPKQYQSAETSGLSAAVEEGENEFQFTLQ